MTARDGVGVDEGDAVPMTDDQAIKQLRDMLEKAFDLGFENEDYDAINMAIEALERMA